jgi:hypothetical protein
MRTLVHPTPVHSIQRPQYISDRQFQEASAEITLILNGVTRENVHLVPENYRPAALLLLTLHGDTSKIMYGIMDVLSTRYQKIKSLCRGGLLSFKVCFLYHGTSAFTMDTLDGKVDSMAVTKETFFQAIETDPPMYMYLEYGDRLYGFVLMKKIINLNDFDDCMIRIGWC